MRPPGPRLRRTTLLLGVALVAAAPLSAQAGTVRGVVTDADTGEAVAGATVIVEGTALAARSAADGRFVLRGLAHGTHRVRVLDARYREAAVQVEVAADAAAEVRIELARRVFDVPALVVTANRGVSRPGDQPVSLSVMTGEEIRDRNAISLDEALPFAQGVLFNAGQIDIRGATGLARGVGSRVLMLVDGHRVLSGVGGSIEFDALPILDVERVEIVKGPHSTLYGTNALGGVINVITRRPPAEPETVARAYYGLFDTPSDHRFTDERLSMRGLGIQHSRRIGEVGATWFAAREVTDGFRQNGRAERWRLRSKTVFPVGSANPWELSVAWTREDEEEFFTWRSEDRPLEVDPVELGDWSRDDDLFIGLTASPVTTPGVRVRIRPHVYHARVQNHFHDNEDFHRSTRWGTDVEVSTVPARDHALTVGGEAASTGVSSNFLSVDPDVTDLALYALDEIRLSDRVRGSAGVRVDAHDASSAEGDVAVNPKLGIVVEPRDGLSLRASVGRGYRAPSVSEQFTSTSVFGFRVIPNLELTAESAWAGEIGATAGFGERVWVDAGLFWSEYTDLIEPAPVQDEFLTFQFQNVAEATVRGLDAGVRVGLFPGTLGLDANYVFLDTEDARTGDPLPYRSRHNLSTTLTALEGLAAVDVRYRSRVDEVLAFPLDDRTSVTTVDLRLAYRLLGTVLQAKVTNLFQNSYVDVQERSPGATRSFRLTVMPRF